MAHVNHFSKAQRERWAAAQASRPKPLTLRTMHDFSIDELMVLQMKLEGWMRRPRVSLVECPLQHAETGSWRD